MIMRPPFPSIKWFDLGSSVVLSNIVWGVMGGACCMLQKRGFCRQADGEENGFFCLWFWQYELQQRTLVWNDLGSWSFCKVSDLCQYCQRSPCKNTCTYQLSKHHHFDILGLSRFHHFFYSMDQIRLHRNDHATIIMLFGSNSYICTRYDTCSVVYTASKSKRNESKRIKINRLRIMWRYVCVLYKLHEHVVITYINSKWLEEEEHQNTIASGFECIILRWMCSVV